MSLGAFTRELCYRDNFFSYSGHKIGSQWGWCEPTINFKIYIINKIIFTLWYWFAPRFDFASDDQTSQLMLILDYSGFNLRFESDSHLLWFCIATLSVKVSRHILNQSGNQSGLVNARFPTFVYWLRVFALSFNWLTGVSV